MLHTLAAAGTAHLLLHNHALQRTLACSTVATPSSGKMDRVSAMNSLSGHSLIMALTLTPLDLLNPTGRTRDAFATLAPENAARDRLLMRCCNAILILLLLLYGNFNKIRKRVAKRA